MTLLPSQSLLVTHGGLSHSLDAMRLTPVHDAKLTSFASCRERLKRGLIVMRKSDASETVLGRQKRPMSVVAGVVRLSR